MFNISIGDNLHKSKIQFSGENKNYIINMSSVELAQRVGTVKVS